MTKKPLHIPHRSRHVSEGEWADFPRTIPAAWQAIAARKGFRVDRRIRDRYHVALECRRCRAHTAQKAFTLRTAQPACGGCQAGRRHLYAEKAGFTFLRRDAAHRHYNTYRLPCGHERRLQRGRLTQLAEEGVTRGRRGYHCPICHTQKLQAQAATWGWNLVGADPDGDANYRLLAHQACGHQQRVATANMETGRYNCGGCGDGWSAAPSALYLMRFRVPGQGCFIKLGYSRNPDSRLRYQLGLRDDVEAELIEQIPMPSGQVALRVEKGLHGQLMSHHPDAVIPRDMLADWINVTSEIYTGELEPVIRRMLDEVESPCLKRRRYRRSG